MSVLPEFVSQYRTSVFTVTRVRPFTSLDRPDSVHPPSGGLACSLTGPSLLPHGTLCSPSFVHPPSGGFVHPPSGGFVHPPSGGFVHPPLTPAPNTAARRSPPPSSLTHQEVRRIPVRPGRDARDEEGSREIAEESRAARTTVEEPGTKAGRALALMGIRAARLECEAEIVKKTKR